MADKLTWYESHITVEYPEDAAKRREALTKLTELCREIDAKPLLIQLRTAQAAEPLYPTHLMIQKNAQLHDDAEAIMWSDNHMEILGDAGFILRRQKVEAEISEGPAVYFEAHWKVGIVAADQEAMLGFTRRYPQLYYSTNMLNGNQYVSARWFELDIFGATHYFGETSKLINRRFPVIKGHYERVILDSYPIFDRNWAYA